LKYLPGPEISFRTAKARALYTRFPRLHSVKEFW